jgi:hypothetical protein
MADAALFHDPEADDSTTWAAVSDDLESWRVEGRAIGGRPARRGELVTLVHHGGDPVDVPIAGVEAMTGERVESVRLGAFDWALVVER